MSMDSDTTRWIVLAILNTPLYFGLGLLFFGDWDGFLECLKFWFTPDWISMLRGEWWEDNWAEMKLGLFLGLCSLAVYGEHALFFGQAHGRV